MNCLIIAGEKSGEESALTFLPEIKKSLPELRLWGVGGDSLEAAGVELLYHLRDFSSFGVSNIVKKIPFYLNAMKTIENEVETRKCRVAILIDFQGFNLRLAQKLSKKGVQILYYVAPQAWAWRSWRGKKIAKAVNTLFVLLPFEKKWFSNQGVQNVKHVPHPVFLEHQYKIEELENLNKRKQLLLLPGSRNSEMEFLLDDFLKVAEKLKAKYSFEIAMVRTNSVKDSWYEYAGSIVDKFYESKDLDKSLKDSYVILAASGTVSLTSALYQKPTVVAYKVSLLNEFIGRNFVNYKGAISLANIILGKMVLPEFIQEDLEVEKIVRKLSSWIEDPKLYKQKQTELSKLKTLLGGEDERASKRMIQVIEEAY